MGPAGSSQQMSTTAISAVLGSARIPIIPSIYRQQTETLQRETRRLRTRRRREAALKVAARYAGYVDPGPTRPPFADVPPEIDAAQKKKAERWNELCDRYRVAVAT